MVKRAIVSAISVARHAGLDVGIFDPIMFSTPDGPAVVRRSRDYYEPAPIPKRCPPVERLIRADMLEEQGHALLALAERMQAWIEFTRCKRRTARLQRFLGIMLPLFCPFDTPDLPPTERAGVCHVGFRWLIHNAAHLLMGK